MNETLELCHTFFFLKKKGYKNLNLNNFNHAFTIIGLINYRFIRVREDNSELVCLPGVQNNIF